MIDLAFLPEPVTEADKAFALFLLSAIRAKHTPPSRHIQHKDRLTPVQCGILPVERKFETRLLP